MAAVALAACGAERADENEVNREPIEVATFTGTEDTDTADFEVHDTWELHWKIQGDDPHLVAKWSEPGAQFPTDYISTEDTEGSTLVREGGTFYLEVSTFGPDATWELRVVDVPN